MATDVFDEVDTDTTPKGDVFDDALADMAPFGEPPKLTGPAGVDPASFTPQEIPQMNAVQQPQRRWDRVRCRGLRSGRFRARLRDRWRRDCRRKRCS
jgi:hypothetical protein